jgi:hypothetical protein
MPSVPDGSPLAGGPATGALAKAPDRTPSGTTTAPPGFRPTTANSATPSGASNAALPLPVPRRVPADVGIPSNFLTGFAPRLTLPRLSISLSPPPATPVALPARSSGASTATANPFLDAGALPIPANWRTGFAPRRTRPNCSISDSPWPFVPAALSNSSGASTTGRASWRVSETLKDGATNFRAGLGTVTMLAACTSLGRRSVVSGRMTVCVVESGLSACEMSVRVSRSPRGTEPSPIRRWGSMLTDGGGLRAGCHTKRRSLVLTCSSRVSLVRKSCRRNSLNRRSAGTATPNTRTCSKAEQRKARQGWPGEGSNPSEDTSPGPSPES